ELPPLPVLGRAQQTADRPGAPAGAEDPRRQLANLPRGGYGALPRRACEGLERVRRPRLQLVLPPRLEALLSRLVRRAASLGASAVPEIGRDPPPGPVGQGRDVRAAARWQQAARPPRSLRRLAALPSRAGDTQQRQVPHLYRRRALFLARRRGDRVR